MTFDPNGIGLDNGNFIGLPFTEDTAQVVLLPVPWEVTTSFRRGTAHAPEAILKASRQLDLYHPDYPDGWKKGIYFKAIDQKILDKNNQLSPLASSVMDALEQGASLEENEELTQIIKVINEGSAWLNDWVYQECAELLKKGKKVGLIGGEHSVPLGYYRALADRYEDFGILQIDAHCDLRNAYEGFEHSHASIMHNTLQIKQVSQLTQVGIRDYCQAEVDVIATSADRIAVWTDRSIRQAVFTGRDFDSICQEITRTLPKNVHISFDIDGLDPKLCPNTGTPVPGGLDWQEAIHLITTVVKSGRNIIGFDVVEVGNSEWDANVGARLIYELALVLSDSSLVIRS